MTVFQLMEMYRKIGEYLKPLALKIPVFEGAFGSPLFGEGGSAVTGSGLAVSGGTVPEAAITPDLTREESAALRFSEAFFPTSGKFGSGINSAGKASPISFSENPLPTTASVLYTVPFIGENSHSAYSVKGLDNIQLGKNTYAAETGFAEGRSVSGETQSAFPRSAFALSNDVWENTSHLRYSEAEGITKSKSSDLADLPERLRLLRGAAESAASGFGAPRIQVDLSGMSNTVNSRNDMDELIERLCGAFTDAAYSMAEGVHY
ncbi:MAG: hypothetical protein ACI4QY_07595 [Oscillospiraceae bacterium]